LASGIESRFPAACSEEFVRASQVTLSRATSATLSMGAVAHMAGLDLFPVSLPNRADALQVAAVLPADLGHAGQLLCEMIKLPLGQIELASEPFCAPNQFRLGVFRSAASGLKLMVHDVLLRD
jgi:hypothetical protein